MWQTSAGQCFIYDTCFHHFQNTQGISLFLDDSGEIGCSVPAQKQRNFLLSIKRALDILRHFLGDGAVANEIFQYIVSNSAVNAILSIERCANVVECGLRCDL